MNGEMGKVAFQLIFQFIDCSILPVWFWLFTIESAKPDFAHTCASMPDFYYDIYKKKKQSISYHYSKKKNVYIDIFKNSLISISTLIKHVHALKCFPLRMVRKISVLLASYQFDLISLVR